MICQRRAEKSLLCQIMSRKAPVTPAKRKAPAQADEFSTLDVTPPVTGQRKTFEKGFPVEVVPMMYNDAPTGNYGLKMDLTRRFNQKGEDGFNNNDAVKVALAVACLARPVK